MEGDAMTLPNVCISYSHKDEYWKDLLRPHLGALEMQDRTTIWDDRQIEPGGRWINEIKQVPGRGVTWNFNWGFTLDNPNYPTKIYGVFDDKRRLMMIINFNTDLGDGWEHTFDPFYPTSYCNEAYKQGINYIIYALSH